MGLIYPKWYGQLDCWAMEAPPSLVDIKPQGMTALEITLLYDLMYFIQYPKDKILSVSISFTWLHDAVTSDTFWESYVFAHRLIYSWCPRGPVQSSPVTCPDWHLSTPIVQQSDQEVSDYKPAYMMGSYCWVPIVVERQNGWLIQLGCIVIG